MKNRLYITSSIISICISGTAFAQADEQASATDSEGSDIVVTAQKRSESITRVPMSITAVSGDELVARGVNGPADLAKVVPSFTYAPTTFGTPVYTVRGVGFYENALAASPAVGVYIDQTPLPYSAMTRLVAFDLERVEVLKGPQGTLFGQNATGGAINYIAAKPTSTPGAGTYLEYGRFGAFVGQGHVTGPISGNLNARLAVKSEQSGPWQRSTSRDAELGRKDTLAGRLSLDWRPTDPLSVLFTVNGWRDQSDTQAPQFQLFSPLNPNSCDPAFPQTCGLAAVAALSPPTNARDADWGLAGATNLGGDPEYRRDDNFAQASGRVDYELGSATLTSITSYSRYKQNALIEADATQFNVFDYLSKGKISTFSGELRLSSASNRAFRWLIGANYQNDDIDDAILSANRDCSCSLAVSPFLPFFGSLAYSNSRIKTAAVFGNVDYEISEQLTGHASIRYTDVRIDNVSSLQDLDGSLAPVFNVIIFALNGAPGRIRPGGDAVLTIAPDATTPSGVRATPGALRSKLDENNVGWRVGLDFTPREGALLYANVSQGYKAGTFPLLVASSTSQFAPVTQEKLIAYEVGGKLKLLDGKVQLNAAGFYYDYTNKQVRGRAIDAINIFGPLDRLVNVPKSRIYGFEFSGSVRPAEGLTASLTFTNINSRITRSFLNFDPNGNVIDFKGLSFSFTPKYSLVGDVRYELPIMGSVQPFIGASVTYQSSITTAFSRPGALSSTVIDKFYHPGARFPGDYFKIDGYALVDVNAGLKSPDDSWRATLWIRNLTNEYYMTNKVRNADTSYGWAGMPRTFGVSLAFRYR